MKSILFTFGMILLCFASQARYYSMITSSHTHNGCEYFNVTVFDDNGTPGNTSDDIRMGSGTISDCEVHQMIEDPTSNVLETAEAPGTPPCLIFSIEIYNGDGSTIATGVVGSCD